MSKTGRNNPRRSERESRSIERRLSIRAIRREAPDVQRLGRAFIALAIADAERQAQAAVGSEATEGSSRDRSRAEKAE